MWYVHNVVLEDKSTQNSAKSRIEALIGFNFRVSVVAIRKFPGFSKTQPDFGTLVTKNEEEYIIIL
jgi:hypothetical protein